MRDEIRKPNKLVWLIVGLIAFLIALLAVLAPSTPTKKPDPPFAVVLFVPPLLPEGFDPEEALELLRKQPNDVETLVGLQSYYANKGDWSKALEVGEQIVNLPEGRSNVYSYLGIIYALINLNRTDEVWNWLHRAFLTVHDGMGRAQLHRVRGDLHLIDYLTKENAYKLQDAKREYESALKLWREAPLVRANLAYVWFRLGEGEKARQLVNEVLASKETTTREKAVATYWLAQIEESQGNKEVARQLYHKAKSMHPPSFVLRK